MLDAVGHGPAEGDFAGGVGIVGPDDVADDRLAVGADAAGDALVSGPVTQALEAYCLLRHRRAGQHQAGEQCRANRTCYAGDKNVRRPT